MKTILVLIGLLVASTPALQAAGGTVRLNHNNTELARVLKDIARQTRLTLVYSQSRLTDERADKLRP